MPTGSNDVPRNPQGPPTSISEMLGALSGTIDGLDTRVHELAGLLVPVSKTSPESFPTENVDRGLCGVSREIETLVHRVGAMTDYVAALRDGLDI